MDSFKQGVMKFMSFEYGLNLDDILFKYGVRVNNDLVEDLQNIQIPLMNGAPQMRNYDWVYYPKINPTSQHSIVRNMDFIQGTFTSSIDTIFTPTIRKTILLTTSKYSRTAGSPVTVSLTKINYPGREEYFNKPYRPVAVLLEGKFHSVYEHRLAPEYLARLDSLKEPFVPYCKQNTSMIVTSIGDVFKNDYSTKDGVMPLGYNKYMGEFFANKSFLLNSLEYLTDHSGVLEARSKDIKLRLLDTGRVKEELNIWQWVNILVPIVIILMFASAFMFFRKRKYENSWKKVA
jgi:gliding-associated putative ABC transporter substrate-binding component GldG